MSYKTALLLMSAVSIGCGPRFQPEYDPAWNCFDHIESAPIIVVARIDRNAVTVVGKSFMDKSLPGDPLALLKVKMSVENVLKGTVPLGDTDFFYISEAIPHGPTGDGFFSTETFRDMLLLRKDQGKLRFVRDVRSHRTATVYSGAHLNFKPRPGEPLPEQMVDLLLTLGSGATDIGMIRAVFERAPFQISPDYTAKTLLKLAVSEPPIVRAGACLELRDILVELREAKSEKAWALSQQLGLPPPELERWRDEQEQNGRARNWWAHGPFFARPPLTSLSADGPTGLSLCTDDKALGVPPLRKPLG